MATADILNILYAKQKTPEEFNFDRLWQPGVFNFLPPYEVDKIRKISTSIKLSSKIEQKYKMIKEIVTPYGFVLLHAGTNRVVYRHLENTEIVLKIAIDDTGMSDNPREFENQQWLKPFVTKTFDVSPCGTVAIAERVQPITTVEEFMSLSEDIFDLITENIIGEFVLEDIGTKFFRNWGIRNGFGPVLLDYPYVFRLDGNKLYCNVENPITHQICGGVVDYDDGFNFLRCTKCGAMVEAKLLKQEIQENKICIKNEELDSMIVSLVRGNKIINKNEISETSTTTKNNRIYNGRKNQAYKEKTCGLKASLIRGSVNYTDDIVSVKEEVQVKQEQVEVADKKQQSQSTFQKKDEYDTTSQFIKNGIKEEQMKDEEEQNDFIDEEVIKKMQQSMASGFGITQEELNQNQIKAEQENKQEEKEELKDEIEEKYKEYANDDNYEPVQKIQNKKVLSEF